MYGWYIFFNQNKYKIFLLVSIFNQNKYKSITHISKLPNRQIRHIHWPSFFLKKKLRHIHSKSSIYQRFTMTQTVVGNFMIISNFLSLFSVQVYVNMCKHTAGHPFWRISCYTNFIFSPTKKIKIKVKIIKDYVDLRNFKWISMID